MNSGRVSPVGGYFFSKSLLRAPAARPEESAANCEIREKIGRRDGACRHFQPEARERAERGFLRDEQISANRRSRTRTAPRSCGLITICRSLCTSSSSTDQTGTCQKQTSRGSGLRPPAAYVLRRVLPHFNFFIILYYRTMRGSVRRGKMAKTGRTRQKWKKLCERSIGT